MQVNTYELSNHIDEKIKFVVIITKSKNEWIFVRHKERETWEIPGGKREREESVEYAAQRELIEETGAKEYKIIPLFDYSVKIGNELSYGRVFYSEVYKFGALPNLEIVEIKAFKSLPRKLTYPQIQPILFEKALTIKLEEDFLWLQ